MIIFFKYATRFIDPLLYYMKFSIMIVFFHRICNFHICMNRKFCCFINDILGKILITFKHSGQITMSQITLSIDDKLIKRFKISTNRYSWEMCVPFIIAIGFFAKIMSFLIEKCF